MISKISKGGDHVGVFRYVLQPAKQVTVIYSNVNGNHLDRAIRSGDPVNSQNFKSILNELNAPFSKLKQLAPRITQNVVHISVGFDPKDGEVSQEIKSAIGFQLLDRLGYSNCPKIVCNHHRNDPGHDRIHDHDHIHLVASTIDYNCRRISDSHDFARARELMRTLEQEYNLTPFLFREERELQQEKETCIVRPHVEITTLTHDRSPAYQGMER
jgi:hypothetical protein